MAQRGFVDSRSGSVCYMGARGRTVCSPRLLFRRTLALRTCWVPASGLLPGLVCAAHCLRGCCPLAHLSLRGVPEARLPRILTSISASAQLGQDPPPIPWLQAASLRNGTPNTPLALWAAFPELRMGLCFLNLEALNPCQDSFTGWAAR